MAIDGAGEADSWWWMERKPPFIVVVMGVSGSGKTEVGRRLAGALGGEFFDADAYHPAANVAKMSAGIPLTDDDRRPWFERLAREVIEACPDGAMRVLACSALKKTYRDWLRAARPGAVRFVHLDGSFELIYGRMAARKDHFMRADMLRSQFATLEHPSDYGEDDVLSVGIEPPVDEVVRLVVSRLPGLNLGPVSDPDHGPVVTSSPGA